jgi:hypothetical protein
LEKPAARETREPKKCLSKASTSSNLSEEVFTADLLEETAELISEFQPCPQPEPDLFESIYDDVFVAEIIAEIKQAAQSAVHQ